MYGSSGASFAMRDSRDFPLPDMRADLSFTQGFSHALTQKSTAESFVKKSAQQANESQR
jgi:hypothetical protein